MRNLGLFSVPIQRTVGVLALMGVWGCALYDPGNSQQIVRECKIPTDQSGTISGKWPTVPIPIAFHQGDFNTSETSSLTQSADTWNKFFQASKSLSTLDYGGSDARTSAEGNPASSGLCGRGIIPATTGAKFNGNVVIYKDARWPTAYASSAMALTSFCTIQGKPYPTLYMAVMEINYQDFFVSGKKVPDLQSIITHEFGHLLGLNHSCEGTAKTGTPKCDSPSLDPDYITASMYPVFGFDTTGQGQVKRELGSNDQGRANCLYETTPSK